MVKQIAERYRNIRAICLENGRTITPDDSDFFYEFAKLVLEEWGSHERQASNR